MPAGTVAGSAAFKGPWHNAERAGERAETRRTLVARVARTFAQVVTTAELRNKLLFSLGLIVLFRFGANLPVPGISEQNVQYCSGLASTSSSPVAGVYAMLNVLSGNALLHVAVFAPASRPTSRPASSCSC